MVALAAPLRGGLGNRVGDSAGGGLTAATLLALRDAGDPLPACASFISPWFDLTCSGESMVSRAEVDPLLSRERLTTWAGMYAAGNDMRNPLVSPLYGDLAGTLSVIGDLTKPQVYAVARWYAAERGVIPSFVLERAPSAELSPGQVDPFDYPVVAPLVEGLVQGTADASAPDLDAWKRRLRLSEHKRFQHGIILKVSERAFGTGRMVPVTRAF